MFFIKGKNKLFLIFIIIVLLQNCSIITLNKDISNIFDWICIPEIGEIFEYEGVEINENYDYYGTYAFLNYKITRKIVDVDINRNNSIIIKIHENKIITNDSLHYFEGEMWDSTYYMIINADSNEIILSGDTVDIINSITDNNILKCPIEKGNEWNSKGLYSLGWEAEIISTGDFEHFKGITYLETVKTKESWTNYDEFIVWFSPLLGVKIFDSTCIQMIGTTPSQQPNRTSNYRGMIFMYEHLTKHYKE